MSNSALVAYSPNLKGQGATMVCTGFSSTRAARATASNEQTCLYRSNRPSKSLKAVIKDAYLTASVFWWLEWRWSRKDLTARSVMRNMVAIESCCVSTSLMAFMKSVSSVASGFSLGGRRSGAKVRRDAASPR